MKDNADELTFAIFSHTSKEEYGSSYQEHLLEQYKTYIKLVDKISERRANANSFFLTVVTVLISMIGIVSGFGNQAGIILNYWIIAASLAGLILCYSWYRIVESYRQLNAGKFKVVHAIEKKLPLAMYNAEWKILEEGKNPLLYRPLTHIEKWVPIVFAILFALIIVFAFSLH